MDHVMTRSLISRRVGQLATGGQGSWGRATGGPQQATGYKWAVESCSRGRGGGGEGSYRRVGQWVESYWRVVVSCQATGTWIHAQNY